VRPIRIFTAIAWIAVGAATAVTAATAAPADHAVWQALRAGGHAVLIRHATAPGTGDPPAFVLGDCATQRNLSDEGREQARAIGRAFRAAGIAVDEVLTSRWCRSRETAELFDLGPVEPLEALDSFFTRRERGPAQVAALQARIGRLEHRTVVMVTHQVNITALTGIYPGSGEAIVVAPTGDAGSDGPRVRVVGRLAF
jgi:phosphohistidine phosphatase SixA